MPFIQFTKYAIVFIGMKNAIVTVHEAFRKLVSFHLAIHLRNENQDVDLLPLLFQLMGFNYIKSLGLSRSIFSVSSPPTPLSSLLLTLPLPLPLL